jgi:HAD superfamily hydrolase (TIGR01509 family)
VLTRLYPDVFAPFDRLFFCHRLVANKPVLRVYQQVTALLGAEPSRIRFIDDGEDNVAAARRARWTASQYRDIDDLRALIE